MGESENLNPELFQRFIDKVALGEIKPAIDKTFTIDEIVEAHEYMEANRATGKLVVIP